MDFFKRTGSMAIGSRLRMLTDKVTADAAKIYELYEMEMKPKWFPVFFSLKDGMEKSVTAIAKEIGHSHPSVSNILKEMKSANIVECKHQKEDARQTIAVLTDRGRRLVEVLNIQFADVAKAIEQLSKESEHDLWAAIGDWEQLLAQKSLLQRVSEIKAAREATRVEIVPFDDSKHHEAFRLLNEEWIRELFGVVEETDYHEFEHPVENIIDKGGYIFIALLDGEPVGTFGMMRCENPKYDYELVKFAVTPGAQGHGIGRRLIEACLLQARMTGGFRLFLESNHKCAAAVYLYEQYGFSHLKVEHSNYARCDVQMELELS